MAGMVASVAMEVEGVVGVVGEVQDCSTLDYILDNKPRDIPQDMVVVAQSEEVALQVEEGASLLAAAEEENSIQPADTDQGTVQPELETPVVILPLGR